MQNISEALRSVLKSQYHASLAMLREGIARYPDDLWLSTEEINAPWQVAYHTLFFTHLYIQPNEAAFRPWEQHQANVQHPDGIGGPPNPDSTLPLLPEPYTKAQVLQSWDACDAMVDDAVDAFDPLSQDSGFSWYRVSKLEHQIINIRHIQIGAAQLGARLRAKLDVGIPWVGGRRV